MDSMLNYNSFEIKDYSPITHIEQAYKMSIMKFLENEDNQIYIREHFIDSPNYYNNHTIENMIDTLYWLSLSDKDKKEYLDKDLDTYFNSS